MRYLQALVEKDLAKKMVFIGGPRQCGKTTLAKSILEKLKSGRYFNWDDDLDRRDILKRQWQDSDQLLIFDELHKYPKWKNWIKGIYDKQHDTHQMIVTGSARLDIYRRGGDSMFGRYHYWRLHPFTLSELPAGIKPAQAFTRLMTQGGFPEPFFMDDPADVRRWRKERYSLILKDDVRDLESVKNIQMLGLLVDLLKQRVGSFCVASNLAEDLGVAPFTIQSWLQVLERLYFIFIVKPYTTNIARAIQKPPKIYFYDNGDVDDPDGARFENLVATHLLKRIHYLEDRDGYSYELCYIRDKEKREVDFVIVKDKKVIELYEAKYSDDKVSSHLRYYTERLNPIKSVQIVANLKRSYTAGKIQVLSPLEALSPLEE